jgi:hypothetical protein
MAEDGWKTEWEASGGVLRGWINEEASRKQATMGVAVDAPDDGRGT